MEIYVKYLLFPYKSFSSVFKHDFIDALFYPYRSFKHRVMTSQIRWHI